MVSPTDITVHRVLLGHTAAVNVVDFDDKYIVSASGDRSIKVGNSQRCCNLLLDLIPLVYQICSFSPPFLDLEYKVVLD